MYSSKFIILFIMINLIDQLNAFCPAKCVCDESKSRVICSNSQFNVLPIMLNPWLKELYLANNQIKKMTPLNSVYNDLEVLDLSNNQIDYLEDNIFNGLSKLKILKLNGNKISNLTRNSFKGLDALEHLILNNNRIKDINLNVFLNLKNLKRLDLSDNLISNLDSDIFIGQSNLVDLNLSNNLLVFSNLSIDLNPIKSEYLVNLVNLNLAGNHLPNLTKDNSPFTKIDSQTDDQEQPAYLQLKSQFNNDLNAQYTIYSKLAQNQIAMNRRPFQWNQQRRNQPVAERRVIYKRWGNLKELDLSSTQLNLIDNDALSSLNQLQVLKLRNNKLVDISNVVLKEFVNLKLLDISRNQIVQLDKNAFNGLQQLETLNISDCGSLQAINEQAFNGLSKLQRLDINWCPKLTTLDPNMFQPLANLKQLYLKGNGLQSLDDKIVNNAFNLEILDIRQNQLYCDCNLKWLVNVLRMYANQSTYNLPPYIPFAEQQQQLRFELSQVYCAGPTELKGKLISELTNEELNCLDIRLIVFICCGVFVGIIIVALIILGIWMCLRYGRCTFLHSLKHPFKTDNQINRQIGFKTNSLNRPTTQRTLNSTLSKLLGTGNLYQTDKTFNIVNNGKPEFTWLPSSTNTKTTGRFTNTLNNAQSNYTNNSTLIFSNSNQTSTICPSMITNSNNYFNNNQRNDSTIITNLNSNRLPITTIQQQHLQPIDTYDCNSYLHHNYATLYETLNSPVNEHYGSSSISTTTTLSSANQSQNSNTNLVVANNNNLRNQSLRYQHTCLQTWNPSFNEKLTPMINHGNIVKPSI